MCSIASYPPLPPRDPNPHSQIPSNKSENNRISFIKQWVLFHRIYFPVRSFVFACFCCLPGDVILSEHFPPFPPCSSPVNPLFPPTWFYPQSFRSKKVRVSLWSARILLMLYFQVVDWNKYCSHIYTNNNQQNLKIHFYLFKSNFNLRVCWKKT